MVTTAQEKRQARMAATIAKRQAAAQEQADREAQAERAQRQIDEVMAGMEAETNAAADIGRPSSGGNAGGGGGGGWVNEAADRMAQGDGAWVKLGEHLTRQSAEHGRARLRRRLRELGRLEEFELWVTVDRARISKETLRRGDKALRKAEAEALPRPKMRRPAAVFGRWVKGSIEAESVQQRQAGQAGGAATRDALAGRKLLERAAANRAKGGVKVAVDDRV